MSFATVGMSKIYCPCLFSDLKNHTTIPLIKSTSVSELNCFSKDHNQEPGVISKYTFSSYN